MRLPMVLMTAVALTTLLVACGADGQNPTSAPVTRGGPSVPQTPSERDPADPPPARIRTVEPSGAWDLVLKDVRVAEREGFDRMVLEFEGSGTPGWAARYVDEAVLDGSGRVVPLDGDVLLQLDVAGTPWPPPGDDIGPEQVEPATGGAFVDVRIGGPFEGYTQVFAGLRGSAVPFRVFALSAPSRLVVDVGQSAG